MSALRPLATILVVDDEKGRACFSIGADEHVAEPFNLRGVAARVQLLLGRSDRAPTEPPKVRCFGEFVLDEGRHGIVCRGSAIPLTPRESDLPATLAAHRGKVFARSQVLEQVWGSKKYDDHVVAVYVGSLRKKLDGHAAHPRYGETIRGADYRFVARED